MNIHKNARMAVDGRALLMGRMRAQSWRVEDAALAADIAAAASRLA